MPPNSFYQHYLLKHYTLEVMCNPSILYPVACSTKATRVLWLLLQFNIDRWRWYLIVIYIIERDKLGWLPLESREFIVQDRVILSYSLSLTHLLILFISNSRTQHKK